MTGASKSLREIPWLERLQRLRYLSDEPVGHDRWLVNQMFEASLSEGYRGWFVEAGGSDGIGASNTFVLETEFGWNGLLVEPNTVFFDQMVRNRRAHCVNVALDATDGEVEFIHAGYASVVTAHLAPTEPGSDPRGKSHAAYQTDADGAPARTTRMGARSLTSLLAEYSAPPLIDYLSLDVEGGEYAVLSGLDFGRYRFRCITLETRYYVDAAFTILRDASHRAPCRALLESNGYRLAKTVGPEDFYVADVTRD